jgi:hypothetical protein
MARRLPHDAELSRGLHIEGFAVAGTPAAFDFLGPHEVVNCVRCGARISYVLMTSKGPMGGDCYATLTGDQTTRRQWRKIEQSFEKAKAYGVRAAGVVVEHDRRGSVLSLKTYGDQMNEWTGEYYPGRSWFLGAIGNSPELAEAIGTALAEAHGLPFEAGARKSPLDPYAFDKEPVKLTDPRRKVYRREHIGVFTTGTIEIAVSYAVQRAMLQGDSIGIVFELNTEGLDEFRELDTSIMPTNDKFLRSTLERAINHVGSVDDALYMVLDLVRGTDVVKHTWIHSVMGVIENDKLQIVIEQILKHPDRERFVFRAIDRGFPKPFWEAIDQQKYLYAFEPERVLRIHAVRPVNPWLCGYGVPCTTTLDQPQDISAEAFSRDGRKALAWLPDMLPLFDSGVRVRVPQYHGTDLTRAQKAFPEFGIENPFDYVQEKT